MSKQQVLTMDGVALEALSNARFRVELDNGCVVQAAISGKMRQKYIKVLPGDRVRVEFSPYDLAQGRISYDTPALKAHSFRGWDENANRL